MIACYSTTRSLKLLILQAIMLSLVCLGLLWFSDHSLKVIVTSDILYYVYFSHSVISRVGLHTVMVCILIKYFILHECILLC